MPDHVLASCKTCSAEFTKTKKNHVFCSLHCREVDRRKRPGYRERTRNYAREWAKNHPGRKQQYNKEYQKRNRERIKARAREWQAENRESVKAKNRAWRLRVLFGMTQADYDLMLAKQNGVCRICGKQNRGNTAHLPLAIDHDHQTGAIRGLLCNRCNLSLGWFEDHKAVVLNYLEGTIGTA